MPAAIELRGVSKAYGQFKAVDDVTLDVDKGETFGLLGANGAGKSTLMNLISFLSKPSAGEVTVFGGRDRLVLGLAPQEDSFYADLTVEENLVFFGHIYSVPGKELEKRIAATLSLLNLADKRRAPARSLSGGMKRRLNMACALMHAPKLLILDEPSAGLDPISRRALWATIRKLKSQGMTILLTTHYLDEADILSDRIAVMQKGKIVALGTPVELKKKVLSEISLSLHRAPKRSDIGYCAKLTSHPCRADGNTLVIPTFDPEAVLPALMRHFARRMHDVEVKKPSLEDFFIGLEVP